MATGCLVIKPKELHRDRCYNFIVNTWDVRIAHRILEFLHGYIDHLDGDECTITGRKRVIQSRRFYFYSVPYSKICEMTAVLLNNKEYIDTQVFFGNLGNYEFDRPQVRSAAIQAVIKPSRFITGTECDFCCAQSVKLWRCKGCMTAKYCSRIHQKNSWKKSHRFVCKTMRGLYLQWRLLKLQRTFKDAFSTTFGVLMIMRDCICDLTPGEIPLEYNAKEGWGILNETNEWRRSIRLSTSAPTYRDLLPSTYELLDILGLD